MIQVEFTTESITATNEEPIACIEVTHASE